MQLFAWLLACPPSPVVEPDPEDSEPTVHDSPGDDSEAAPPPQVWINEFMADNGGSVTDAAGNAVDWLELYNPGDEDLDLDGWWISDDAEDPRKHVISQLTLPAGGHLVLYADKAPELGPEHLDFSLDKSGEALLISDAEGRRVDQLDFPTQGLDVAAARSSDGAETWLLSASPTPGQANPTVELDPPSLESEALCALSSQPEPAWFTEGDRVELSLACAGELSLAEAEVELLVAPEDAVLDGSEIAWSTGLADAGVSRVVLSLRPRGATARVPEAGEVQAWVADAYDDPDNVLVDPLLYTEEWGLPVIHLQPWGAVSQSYVEATVTVEGQAYDGEMKIRGASSSSFPKPSYTLAFEDQEVLFPGWERTRKRMVLLSTFDDNAYVRQKLIYDQWEATAAVSGDHRLCPHTEFAVVYQDGVYLGLYVLLDHVDDEFLAHQGLNGDGNPRTTSPICRPWSASQAAPRPPWSSRTTASSTRSSSWTGSCWSTTAWPRTLRARTPTCSTTRWTAASASCPGTSTTPGARTGTPPAGTPRP
jgi:hypothetical protein